MARIMAGVNASLNQGLTGYYTFNNTYTEIFSSITASPTSVSFESNYIRLPQTLAYLTLNTSFSYWYYDPGAISFWVWMDAHVPPGTASLLLTNNTTSWAIGGAYSGSSIFTINYNGNSTPLGTTISTNAWHHVLFVQDGAGNGVFYIDGAATNTFVIPTYIPDPLVINTVGLSSGSYYFPGAIKHLAFWNRTLSAQDATDLYNGGVPNPYPFYRVPTPRNTSIQQSLAHYWQFDEDSTDVVGGNNGTNTNISYVAGKHRNALHFNASTSKVTISPTVMSGDYTISFWYKPGTTAMPYRAIFSGSGIDQGIYYDESNARMIYYRGLTIGGDDTYHMTSATSLTWNQFTVVVSGSTGQWYVNGVANGGTFAAGGITADVIGNVHPAFSANGDMDDLAVWDRALTSGEVLKLYEGGGFAYPFNRLVAPRYTQLLTGLVSWHRLTSDATDSHGNNDGTNVNALFLGGASYATGGNTGGYISGIGETSTYSFIQNTMVFGISFWVKFNNYTTIPQYIINSTGTTVEKGFYLGNAGVTGRLEFVVTYGVSSHFVCKTFAPGIFTDNNWHHIVVTGNGTEVRVYKNGALSYTDTAVPFDSLSSGDSTREIDFFNIPGYNLERLNGYLDEVGIWNREITDAEALILYNNGNRLSYPF